MRLIRYKLEGKEPLFGCVEGDDVYQLTGNPLGECSKGPKVSALDDVNLLAPCQPKKIIAMAINFPGIDHYSPEMSEPMVFIKPSTSACNPGDEIVSPFPGLPIWGEAELGVVIKNKLVKATPQEVKDGILGFTIGNDVTVDNVDGRDHHLARSKCPDNFCPLGPWIDTEFDATDCLIQAVQNNEVIRQARSTQQVWQWPKILEWLSGWMTLEPWDVVLTGNPPDTVGMRFIKSGDVYTARIEGLGELTNTFRV